MHPFHPAFCAHLHRQSCLHSGTDPHIAAMLAELVHGLAVLDRQHMGYKAQEIGGLERPADVALMALELHQVMAPVLTHYHALVLLQLVKHRAGYWQMVPAMDLRPFGLVALAVQAHMQRRRLARSEQLAQQTKCAQLALSPPSPETCLLARPLGMEHKAHMAVARLH